MGLKKETELKNTFSVMDEEDPAIKLDDLLYKS